MTEPRVRWGVGLIGLGVLLVVAYKILQAAETGKIGAPTDIGGALIPLAGFAAIFAGVVLLINGLLDRRSKK